MFDDQTTAEVEASLAALLAQALADRSWWAKFAAVPDDEKWRTHMAERALELYRLTAPVLEARVTKAPPQPIDRGIAMVREIADACAMLSHKWTKERAQLGIPTRALIEFGIRLYDVDKWAANLGSPLDLREPGGLDEAWSAETERSADHLSDLDLASAFSFAAQSYEQILEARETEMGRAALSSENAREGACEMIGLSRGWLIWARGRFESDAESVAVMLLFVAQGFFIASREETPGNGAFPGKEFLRTFLHWSGAYEWLTTRGADIPDWLA